MDTGLVMWAGNSSTYCCVRNYLTAAKRYTDEGPGEFPVSPCEIGDLASRTSSR